LIILNHKIIAETPKLLLHQKSHRSKQTDRWRFRTTI
jgi:hypothetical protein